jgi:hypothetical protein
MKKILLLLATFFLSGLTAEAQDVIRLKNGNELNGELKSMDRGVLVIETPYSDSDFKIDWSELEYIKTQSVYMISLSKEKMESLVGSMHKKDSIGDRISSTLETDPNNPQRVLINTSYGKKSINLNQIVYLNSFSDSFLSRLSASVDVGFTVTKANNLKQFNVSSLLGYESDKWGANAGLNIVNSVQDDVDRIHRLDANVGFNWYLPKDFFLATSTTFLENDEMDLDLRTTIKAGLGYFFLHTNSLYWKLEGGVAYNNEKYFINSTIDPPIDPNPRISSEGYISTELNLFDIGDFNLFTNIAVYPSITESGRVRTDFKFEAKYDLPYDLYLKAGTTLNYDNQPAGEAKELDYVINTGVGWEL